MVVIATYRREKELRRCLDSILVQTHPVHAVVLADNTNEPVIKKLLDHFSFSKKIYLGMTENKGCGAGLKAAEIATLEQLPESTHFLVLDDDVVLGPTVVSSLLSHMEKHGAELMAPLLTDDKDQLWGLPEPRQVHQIGLPRKQRLDKIIRTCSTPIEALEKLGAEPHQMWWCTGACLLVTTNAVKKVGPHREDFWMLGEDHEFSMRVGASFKSMFCCDVVVRHLPPQGLDPVKAECSHYLKFISLLQNLSYNSFHTSGSGPMKFYLAGNYKRFFQTFGFTPKTVWHSVLTLWFGAFCAEPAGLARGARLRASITRDNERLNH